jgi:hypothetical protein
MGDGRWEMGDGRKEFGIAFKKVNFMEYKASLDTLSKIITVVVIILLTTIAIKNVMEIIDGHGNLKRILIHGGILLLTIAIILICYLYRTTRYTITENKLVINRPVGNREINFSDISEIRIVDKADFFGTIRTFGNGGLFGYYGKFYNSKLGSTTWYVTQRRNRIFVHTKQGDKIIISPDDVTLVEKVQRKKETAM